jgi:hypothetical protein
MMNQENVMNEPRDNASTADAANNEVGPTEKLREGEISEGELSVPGAQNPASNEIKDEQAPNTE